MIIQYVILENFTTSSWLLSGTILVERYPSYTEIGNEEQPDHPLDESRSGEESDIAVFVSSSLLRWKT